MRNRCRRGEGEGTRTYLGILVVLVWAGDLLPLPVNHNQADGMPNTARLNSPCHCHTSVTFLSLTLGSQPMPPPLVITLGRHCGNLVVTSPCGVTVSCHRDIVTCCHTAITVVMTGPPAVCQGWYVPDRGMGRCRSVVTCPSCGGRMTEVCHQMSLLPPTTHRLPSLLPSTSESSLLLLSTSYSPSSTNIAFLPCQYW